MKELLILIKTDLRNILKNKFIWLYIIITILTTGLKSVHKLYNGDLRILLMSFSNQMAFIFFSLPFAMALTLNDTTMKFIPSVLIPKLKNRKLFFLSQFISYFCLATLVMLLGNLKVMIFVKVHSGNYSWLYFTKYLAIFSTRLLFYISFIILLWVIFEKFMLVMMLSFMINFISMTLQHPIFSMLLGSGDFAKVILHNDKSMLVGGFFYMTLSIVITILSINIYDKKLEKY